MLLTTLCASLLGNLLTCEGTVKVDQVFNATSFLNKFGSRKA